MSKAVKTMDIKIKRSGLVIKVELSTWPINHSPDVSKDRLQRSVTTVVTSRMKNPTKKLEVSQFLPKFQALVLLFLRNRKLDNKFGNIFSRFIEVRSWGFGQGEPG